MANSILEATRIQNKINNLAGKISALSSGDIQKAEFLSGEQIVPIADPVTQYLENERNKPLQEIKEELVKLNPDNKKTEDDKQLAIVDQQNQPARGIIRIDLTAEKNTFFTEETDLKNPTDPNIKINVREELSKLDSIIRRLNNQRQGKRGIEKGRYTRKINTFEEYKKILTGEEAKIKIGRGLSQPCPILEQMAERVRVLLGEIQAGNTSTNLRNELSRLLLHLYKNNVISKSEYRTFSHLNI